MERQPLDDERRRRDVEAYIRWPQTAEEIAMAAVGKDYRDIADDTDWEQLYRKWRRRERLRRWLRRGS